MKNISKKLKELRNAFGLTQKEFADKIGITKASINGYENNVNPLTQAAKWKIIQATGIGPEYFDSNMSLEEAFEKFNLNPTKLELRETNECVCTFYESLSDFAKRKYVEVPFKLQTFFLRYIFKGNIGTDNLQFVEIKNSVANSCFKDGDILIVSKDRNILNNEFIVIEYNKTLMIVRFYQYFDQIILEIDKEKKTFDHDEFRKSVKILGIVIAKFSIKLLSDLYL